MAIKEADGFGAPSPQPPALCAHNIHRRVGLQTDIENTSLAVGGLVPQGVLRLTNKPGIIIAFMGRLVVRFDRYSTILPGAKT
jgi:hypothetical protein